jgi:hypothetical protein
MKGGIIMQATVIKSSTTNGLQTKINEVLRRIGDGFVDMKLAGASDSGTESYVAVILHK